MQQHAPAGRPSPAEFFPTDPTGLPEATRPELLELADGDAFELRISPVAKRLEGTTVRMLGYNGSIPGPVLKVRQGSEVIVHVTNDGDLDATVHWHGLRLDNKYDGVPHETQTPIPVGGDFTYRIRFPDPGLYWYHPHIREDYTQEMGLYGNILVVPAEEGYWPPAHRDVLLTLDDLLLEDGKIAPFSPAETTYTAMGRFGNVLLIGGEQDCSLTAAAGEVVRLWLTNTANTRVFNVTLPGARMKLAGGDSGRVEHEKFVSELILAPSERVVVDVLFGQSGQLELQHRTPGRTYRLASITVTAEPAAPSLAEQFEVLRTAPELAAEREFFETWLEAPPDKTLALIAEMDDITTPGQGPVLYTCPMHPEVTSDQPGRCPECGMKLLATATATVYACPMHPEVTSDQPGRCPQCGMKLLVTALAAEPACRSRPPRRTRTAATMTRARITATTVTATATVTVGASSGKTTWLRSTGSPPPPTCGGNWSTGPPAQPTPPSTGSSPKGTGSRSGWSTRWTPTTPCTTPSTCTGPAGSWCWPATEHPSRTWCGKTPCWCVPGRRWTSCSTSPSPACGWRTATSPSTCKAA